MTLETCYPVQEDVKTELAEELSKIKVAESEDFTKPVKLEKDEQVPNFGQYGVQTFPMQALTKCDEEDEGLEKTTASKEPGIVDIDSDVKDPQTCSFCISFPFHVNRQPQQSLNIDDNDDDDDNNNFEPHSGGGFDLISGHHQNSGDMASRCPRGRPPSSMNKPKSSMIITRESANTLRAHILEVGSCCNVFDFVATYARKRQRGICVLSGSGTVTNITFRQLAAAGVVVTLHERFEIISLSGSFLPSPAPPGATNLTVFLAGGQGQVVGGNVVGALIAADPTIVIASSFTNVTYDSFFVTFYSFHVT
ncbi:AT-hook motif nuclear-localized protein 23-like [Humulus lupulus]|uniref:AT-hook motif nuclear-localized protein 23-like n=1 Tax=Humulus lupulus TaxID=3486 RepID=UPI002B405848|nr:AT-hook motif nuclear-localized protein 23-like [Humulus lupulus]